MTTAAPRATRDVSSPRGLAGDLDSMSLLFAALCFGVTFVTGGAGGVLAGLLLGGTLALRAPQLALGLALSFTLYSGQYAWVAQLGHLLALLTCAVALMLSSRWVRRDGVGLALVPLGLIALMAVTLYFGSGLDDVIPLVTCAAAVVGAVLLGGDYKRMSDALGVAGLTFVLASYVMGTVFEFSARYAGVSGNPNRMTLGLLFFLPFVLRLAVGRNSIVTRVAAAAAIALTLQMTIASGSAQGTVGLLLLLLGGCMYLTRRASRFAVGFVGLLMAVLAVWYVSGGSLEGSIDEDTRTLSGRTVAYESGLQMIRDNPVAGSGRIHVDLGIGTQISAHNSLIGITATAGVVAGGMWFFLLLRSVFAAVANIRRGVASSTAGLLVVVIQLVQSVEYTPLAWFGLLFVVVTYRALRQEESGSA
jgi:hypothetical protein